MLSIFRYTCTRAANYVFLIFILLNMLYMDIYNSIFRKGLNFKNNNNPGTVQGTYKYVIFTTGGINPSKLLG